MILLRCLIVLCLLVVGTGARAQSPENDTTCILKPREVVRLGSPVPGLLASIAVDRGDLVQRGQVVANLESSIEEASLLLARARATNDAAIEGEKAEFEMLRRKLNRTRPLTEKQVASVATLEEVESKVDESRARIRAAEMERALAMLEAERAQRQLELRRIRSSITGVVTERKLAPGEYVYEQSPILTIAQVDPLNVELVVPAARYGSISIGMEAEVRPSAPVGGLYRARVEVVDPVIDAASNTFGVRLVLANPTRSIPAGIRCTVTW